MTKREQGKTAWHHQVFAVVVGSVLLVQALLMADAFDGPWGTFWNLMVAVAAIFVSYVLATTVYFMDIMRSAMTRVNAPIDRFVANLGTMLAEEGGGRLLKRSREGVPFYKFRWTEVLDLEGGLAMHIRMKGEWMIVFIGPVGKDNGERVGWLLDLVKRAGSKDDAATLS